MSIVVNVLISFVIVSLIEISLFGQSMFVRSLRCDFINSVTSQCKNSSRRRGFARMSHFKYLKSTFQKTTLQAAGFGQPRSASSNVTQDPKHKLKVLIYPHPYLRAENQLITEFDEELAHLTKDMFHIMYSTDGIGLAAPQVGVNKRLLVFNKMSGEPEQAEHEMVLANPRIINRSPDMCIGEEGCLSFPKIYGNVARNTWIEVEYQRLDGQKVEKAFEAEEAIIFQHEYDHLDKVLFIDHFDEKDKERAEKKLRKLIEKFGPGGVP